MQHNRTNWKLPLGLAVAASIVALAVLMSTVGYASAGQDELAAPRQVTGESLMGARRRRSRGPVVKRGT